MKNLIVFTVCAALFAYTNGATIDVASDGNVVVLDAPTDRSSAWIVRLEQGTVGAGDTVVYRNFFVWAGWPQMIFAMDVLYSGSKTITAIKATEMGNNPTSYASLIEGGLGQTSATVRVGSARSYGYNIMVEIWGK